MAKHLWEALRQKTLDWVCWARAHFFREVYVKLLVHVVDDNEKAEKDLIIYSVMERVRRCFSLFPSLFHHRISV